MAQVLIIEDSPLIVQMLTMICQGAGHEVASCESFAEVKALLTKVAPEVIITDLNLPDIPNGETLTALRELQGASDVPVIIISGRPRAELEALAEEKGAQGALSKDDGMPAISAELPPMIDKLLNA